MTKQMDDLMKPAGWRWLDTGTYRKTLPKTAEVGAWTPLYTELQMREYAKKAVEADVLKIAEALRKVGLTLVMTAHGYHVMDLGQVTARPAR